MSFDAAVAPITFSWWLSPLTLNEEQSALSLTSLIGRRRVPSLSASANEWIYSVQRKCSLQTKISRKAISSTREWETERPQIEMCTRSPNRCSFFILKTLSQDGASEWFNWYSWTVPWSIPIFTPNRSQLSQVSRIQHSQAFQLELLTSMFSQFLTHTLTLWFVFPNWSPVRMWFLLILSWFAILIQLLFVIISVAAGLYYLAELVEEYTVIAGKVIRHLIFVSVFLLKLFILFRSQKANWFVSSLFFFDVLVLYHRVYSSIFARGFDLLNDCLRSTRSRDSSKDSGQFSFHRVHLNQVHFSDCCPGDQSLPRILLLLHAIHPLLPRARLFHCHVAYTVCLFNFAFSERQSSSYSRSQQWTARRPWFWSYK